jgi:CheY-like chemotaxis protein
VRSAGPPRSSVSLTTPPLLARGPSGAPDGAGRLKVLVVEDDPSAAMVLRYQLEDAGYVCFQSATVDEGWEALLAEVPDVAVVDIRLPGVDGWVLLDRMRNDGRFRDLPALVLTGLLQAQDMEHARALGCEYLGKPYAAQALLRKMEDLIEARSSGVPLSPAEAPRPPIKIKLRAVRVVLLLDSYQIEGDIHVAPEVNRFSDAWESVMRDSRSFIPVTKARVLRGDSSKPIATPEFIEVRKSELRGVFPLEHQHPEEEVFDGTRPGC